MNTRFFAELRSPASLLSLLAALVVFARCAFPEGTLYACEEGGGCSQRDGQGRRYVCDEGYCVPPSEVADAGEDGGADAGSDLDGGGDGGGGEPEDGGSDGGTDPGPDFSQLPFTGVQCALGFCFQNPRGGGSHLRSVWGRAADQVFLAGDDGNVLFWDGGSLRRVELTTEDLHAAWANERVVVLGGAGGTLLEFGPNGFEQKLETSAGDITTLTGWGDYAFAANNVQQVFERTDGAWAEQGTTESAVTSAWAADAGVVFVVSRATGELRVRTPASVSATELVVSSGAGLYGIDGLGQRAIAVGAEGRRLDWQGGDWVESTLPSGETLLSVKVFPETAFATLQDAGVLLELTAGGAAGHPSGTDQVLRAVWGAGPADVWAVGDHGAVVRNVDGGFRPPPGFETPDFVDLWIDPAERPRALTAKGEVYGPDDTTGLWAPLPLASGTPNASALYANTSGYLIGTSDGNIVSFDAAGQNPTPVFNDANDAAILDLWGDSLPRFAIVAGGTILRTVDEGSSFNPDTHSCGNVVAFGGTDLFGMWAVGENGAACRLESNSWVSHPLSAGVGTVVAVWANAFDRAVAITSGGYLAEWNGSGWTETLLDDTIPLRAIAGSARSSLAVVGDFGAVFDVGDHDGGTVAPRYLPGGAHLRAGMARGAVSFVAGEDGVVLSR